jgi:cell division protein FtsB
MASPSISIPHSKIQKRERARLATRVLPMKAVIIAFVVLFILFLWLHFILAMDITSTYRQIEGKTGELDRLKRDSSALRREIAKVESLVDMSTRVEGQGYIFQEPLYLMLSQPLPPPTDKIKDKEMHIPVTASDNNTSTTQSPLKDILTHQSNTWLEADSTP